MAGYIVCVMLCVCSIIDRRHGDGALSANIELSAGLLAMVLQAGVNRIVERHP